MHAGALYLSGDSVQVKSNFQCVFYCELIKKISINTYVKADK